ncbi:MAG TPA: site-specific integrase [Candidatus Dormibacteraeota bacterium]|nr:site-specific integrase [Candidatus Dormibacteraeota bacterium]
MAGRRGHNEGSIYRRQDGLWAAAVDLGRVNGRRSRQTFYGATRKEVQDWLKVALRDQQLGTLPAASRETVGQFLTAWLEDSAKPRLRPSTFRSYSDLVRLHVLPTIGHHRLDRLTPQQVQTMLNAKLAEGLSARRVEYLRAVLRTALNQAVKWGMVARNAAGLTNPPRVKTRPVQVLSPDEARRFLEVAQGDRLEALFVVALSLGLRQGEALGLQWEDVDLKKRSLSVAHALQRIDGKMQLVEPKTERSRRTIRMPEVVAGALTAHQQQQRKDRLLAGARWKESRFIFTTTVGTPLEGPSVTRHFQQLLKQAGLPRLRFHDLRHSCASLLLAQGVAPRVVMETLGHSQISLTMNTYSHVMPAVQAEAAVAMDRVLGE